MKKNNMKKAFIKIANYIKDNLVLVFICLLLASLGAVFTIMGPNKIGDMVNYISEGLIGNINMSKIASIGMTLLIIYLLSFICIFVEQFLMAKITLKMSYKMRKDLSAKINKLPQEYFNSHEQGDVLSTITNDVSTLQQGLTNSLPSIICAITQFVGCLIMMFTTQWLLALLSLLITFVGIIITIFIMKHSQRYFVMRQESLGKLNGYVEEMYTGHDIIQISLAKDDVNSKFDKLNQKVYLANWKSQFLSGIMQPLMNIIGNLAYVTICVVGSILAIKDVIKFGVIVSFILYIRLFTAPLTQLAQGMTNLQTSSAAATRIFDLLESKELEDESTLEKLDKNVQGNIEFSHVHFSYPDNKEKTIIKDFSATVKSGEKVAIVGPTGAGKTTMVNLLMKFYDIDSGDILIDNTSIKEISRENIHELFGMVLQDTWLFEGTIRENLVYNLQNITDEQLEKVCLACGLDKFVHSLPQGFDTVISESSSISAGQKQLLTIARAMLQDAPMLILDEATSSVDTRTELLIQQAMDNLTKGRTSFVIAHRLSTIKNASLILVMKDGDVVEKGTHEQLMQQKCFYYNLYNSQFDNATI